MRYKMRKSGALLLCTILLLSAMACKSDSTEGKYPETSGKAETVQQGDEKSGSGENAPSSVTQVPEVSEVIAEVKRQSVTESAERTAVITLSDAGIEIVGDGCEADGSCLKIKEAGVYEISGSLSNGSIYVNADRESEVHLIFNGVTVHNETSAAVYCKKAAKVTVTLAEGSVNTLSDGAAYVFAEGEDEPDATLYAKHDLVINGAGKLAVTSAYKDAVKGKDALYILGGELTVKSAEDGIVGRDLLYVAEGIVTVDAAADALKASNDVDEGLGNISIDGGSFTLTAGTDGVQAENDLTITGGTFLVKTGGGSINASVKNDSFGFGGEKGWGKWGDWGASGESDTEDTDTASAKGLKAGSLVSVTGGRFTLDTSDDSIHCNANVIISGGEITISSGDDGVHADETLEISCDSKIRITKSYEGLEALKIVISGGEIDITAGDDGLNAAGGADGSGFGRPGMGMFGEGEGEVIVNGGTIRVDAGGDGFDSNGDLTINAGVITVFGSTGGGEGALDYGGTFCLNGGTVFAAGGSVMGLAPSNTSGQYSLVAGLASQEQAGSKVEIVVNGETVFSEEVPRQFNYVVASSEDFVKDGAVSVAVNGEVCYEGVLSDVVTRFGASGGMGGFEGGMPQWPDGELPEGMWPGFQGGERPQMPEGEWPGFQRGERPQMPEGERPGFSGGELPQMPEDEWSDFPWNENQS